MNQGTYSQLRQRIRICVNMPIWLQLPHKRQSSIVCATEQYLQNNNIHRLRHPCKLKDKSLTNVTLVFYRIQVCPILFIKKKSLSNSITVLSQRYKVIWQETVSYVSPTPVRHLSEKMWYTFTLKYCMEGKELQVFYCNRNSTN